MRSIEDHIANYAAYHRDRRNIATHFLGIPMIVLGLEALLARVTFGAAGVGVSAALVASGLASLFYLRLDLRFGVAMAALMAGGALVGAKLAAMSLGAWGAAAAVLFVGGWIIQFIGHAFEGRKPAFVDDLIGLLVGPLFLVAEVAFAMGLRGELRDAVVRRAGPTRNGRPAPSA